MSSTFVKSIACMNKVYLTMFHILNPNFFVKHKWELFKWEVCENYFKTKEYFASQVTIIQTSITYVAKYSRLTIW